MVLPQVSSGFIFSGVERNEVMSVKITTNDNGKTVERELTSIPTGKHSGRVLTGRRVIKTDIPVITSENIAKVLRKAYIEHLVNKSEIEYLWRYYKGDQPVLYREKSVRPEINNKMLLNVANYITSFKVGYLFGEPIQYISTEDGKACSDCISKLNKMMRYVKKEKKDKDLGEWMSICGVGYRMVLPAENEELPFEIYTLDPRNTFMVYFNSYDDKPLLGVTYVMDENQNITFYCYSDTQYFEVSDGKVKAQPHGAGSIPIVEYQNNNARLGDFEIVITLLDGLNATMSDSVDGLDQQIQSLLKFVNCDISVDDFIALKDLGAIKVKSIDGATADVNFITNNADVNTQSHTILDDLWAKVLEITGMPNRNGSKSTSDTGSAVLLRDGWSSAESKAKDVEAMFKASETDFLKVVIQICKSIMVKEPFDLSLFDMDIKFTRRNYENIQSKSQVLITMLNNPKIHPKLAFTHCGLFSDPEDAYQISENYYKKALEDTERELNENNDEHSDL